jgi:hypothetical protein
MVCLGDIANVVSLVLTFVFVAIITLHPQVFSAGYLTEGFCVSFADTPFNSHALCFYVDTLFTLILGAICLFNRENKILDRVREGYIGVLGHGVGHLSLYMYAPQASGAGPYFTQVESPIHRFLFFAAIFVFWGAFFYSISPSRLFNAVLTVGNTIAFAFFVPRVFTFTYAQTVLVTCLVMRDLLSTHRKDAWYDIWSWLHTPVVVVSWIEALGCDAGLIWVGGHVWYDASIPFAMLVYSCLAMFHTDANGKAKGLKQQ